MKMQMDGSLNKCMDEYVNEYAEGRADGNMKAHTNESGKRHSAESVKVKTCV